MYEIQRKIAKGYRDKKINYKGEEIIIKEINVSLWTNQHTSYVMDSLGNEFMLNMYYDYKNHEFIPDGYISLML